MSKRSLALLVAEYAFKQCELGLNWEATYSRVLNLLGPEKQTNAAEILEQLAVSVAKHSYRGEVPTNADRGFVHQFLRQAEPLFPLPLHVLPWRPIAELDEKTRYGDEAGFLLLAPELMDADCNVYGAGMGYYQDDHDRPDPIHPYDKQITPPEPEGKDYGGWLACKWSMTNDEWTHVQCAPTHYLKLTGAI